jgi:hypothetical protein
LSRLSATSNLQTNSSSFNGSFQSCRILLLAASQSKALWSTRQSATQTATVVKLNHVSLIPVRVILLGQRSWRSVVGLRGCLGFPQELTLQECPLSLFAPPSAVPFRAKRRPSEVRHEMRQMFVDCKIAMSARSICGMPSSAAHKRRGTAPQDDDGPLPSSSSSSSLGQVSSSSIIPKIPADLTAGLILPFVADRVTRNSACCANKELCLAGKKMTPPWPNKAFDNLGDTVRKVGSSPSGSHLAFAITAVHNGAYELVVHVWDRGGKDAPDA